MHSSTLQSLSDEDLARRAQAGSVDCFEELVRRYQVPLLRFLQKRSTDPHEAEDTVQETLLRAYQSLDRYDDAWPFRTWIFTICYRQSVSRARKTNLNLVAADVSERGDQDESPLDRLEREESAGSIWGLARQTLGAEQFTALWLHYGQSMPARQVGQVMGKSWVWVKTNLHRARKQMLASLTESAAPMSASPARVSASSISGGPS